ncbi:hypothetical protein BDY24DRAFT_396428, partial [Mrakia frigida]|uniref:uncharacterized protein n=1 Tax=Mrakia frigida TaxID=29902 RepID=UPI003FCC0596
MTLPQLPLDVLSEIFSHFFQSFEIPSKGSSSLLLTSKAFRTLSLPFFWRSITIHRPSDFVSLFDRKTGLLHAKGKIGKHRRKWIRELSLGEGAAVPYDPVKIEKASKSKMGIEGDEGRRIHVALKPAKLPNLRILALGKVGYLSPLSHAEDPSYDDLVEALAAEDEAEWQEEKDGLSESEVEEVEDARRQGGFREILATCYGDFFGRLAGRNNKIIGALLTSSLDKGDRLVSLHLPFGPVLGWDLGSRQRFKQDSRIPSNLSQVQNLVVTLHPPTSFTFESPNAFRTAQILAGQIGGKARVRMETMRERARKSLDEVIEKAEEKDLRMFALWEFVEEDGSFSPFVPSLRV